jgi:hypothetical protein
MTTTTTYSLINDFESGHLDNTTFDHAHHVRVIWALIHAHGPLEAIRRFERGLKALTAAAGHPGKYHATITYAAAFLVAQRIGSQGRIDWAQFVDGNPDLLEWPNTLFRQLYPGGVLDSDQARDHFVLPFAPLQP